MRRRKLLVALAGLAVVGAAGIVVLWPRSVSRITQENCDRVQVGMSRADVEAILGPPGDYTTGPVAFGGRVYSSWKLDGTRQFQNEINGPRYDYLTDSAWLAVTFDDAGQVNARGIESWTKVNQGPFDNLLWRAKRQWHRWFPE
jgi:hypothetical protein